MTGAPSSPSSPPCPAADQQRGRARPAPGRHCPAPQLRNANRGRERRLRRHPVRRRNLSKAPRRSLVIHRRHSRPRQNGPASPPGSCRSLNAREVNGCVRFHSGSQRCRMINKEYVALLKQGVEVWNLWRERNPLLLPKLIGADLSGACLVGVNLRKCSLVGADLTKADLCGADLIEADLGAAALGEASLVGADLTG